ncbi:hypothetical protein D9M68_992630 [compost metagenome]
MDGQCDHGRQDGRVGDGDACCCELCPQLGQAAAVEQAAADALNREGDEAQGDSADDARHEVDANDVQRVVEAPAELEADRQGGGHTGDDTEAKCTDRADVGAGRGDGDQAGNNTGSCTQ